MKRVPLKYVQVKDKAWTRAMEENLHFISDMDPDRALAGFRRTAGIQTEAATYGGWEDSMIAGHGLGHYFSALAMEIACGHGDMKERASYIVDGLAACQDKLGSGFLSAAKLEEYQNVYVQFDRLEGKQEGGTWVPWYAMHKVLQGLLDLYTYGEIEKALSVAENLGDWIAERVLQWDEATKRKVLSVEYGGMNDSLYQLYQLTGKEKYQKAAEQFDEKGLYQEFVGMKNRLKGVHANTTIPKVLGYLQGNPEERAELAGRFWQLVVGQHSYATGGIGDMEHFFGDGMLDASRTQCNAESCCVHNMMKLSQLLYETTTNASYLEYIEKALWNARLASMGPKGGYSYFNPMATGYYRLYSAKDPSENPFWCCVGTGMEDFAKVGEFIFCEEEGKIRVNQWISAELHCTNGAVLSMEVNYETGLLRLFSSKDLELEIRMPKWMVNRNEYLPDEETYRKVTLQAGEAFDLPFEMAVAVHNLPDAENAVGFTYGPFVLCVPLGKERWGETTGAGIEVVAPAWKVVFDAAVKLDVTYGRTQRGILDREYLLLPKGETLDSFKENIRSYVKKEDGGFTLYGLRSGDGEERNLKLIPYYRTGDERYGIYWYLQ